MKKIITLSLLCIFALFTFNIYGQVGIGTTAPNTNASLEINSSNRGLLIPRLSLTNTFSPLPLSADVAGMLVYNIATTGDVTPGFY